MKAHRGLFLLFPFLVLGCGKKEASSPPDSPQASAPVAVSSASEQAAGAAEATPPEPDPVLMSVHPQWIISDSQPAVEIVMYGQNLPKNAQVTSNSPNFTIKRVDTDDPGKVDVEAILAPDT